MPSLFDPLSVGALTLPNRIMRSATAERMADPETGRPQPRLGTLYRRLAEGGVGLIVTGHAYVERQGKAHPEMAAMDDDAHIAAWREAVAPAQQTGARVIMQLNHSGASADPRVNPNPLSPSSVATNADNAPRTLSAGDGERIIDAFAAAARRAREAGLDGVQLHGAHGYLLSQFLTPATNHRADAWGGDAVARRAFPLAVIAAVREQVGADYPLWIKLGVAGDEEHGLDMQAGADVAAACFAAGVDCVEVSHALGVPASLPEDGEARFAPLAAAVRQAVGPRHPLALVGWLRSREVMERVLAEERVQLLSLCRPLIVEPDLPAKLRDGRSERAACVSCGRCWPESPGEGIACHNERVLESLR